MKYTYKKPKNFLGSVSSSSGTTFAGQKATGYDNRIRQMGYYNGNNKYSRMLENTLNKIWNRRGEYNIASDQALSQYARDYSVMAGLAAAESKDTVDALGAGYRNDYSTAAANQAYKNAIEQSGMYNIDKQNIAQKINQTDVETKMNAAADYQTLGQFKYQQWQDKMDALRNGRNLWDEAYSKFSDADVKAYMDNIDSKIKGVKIGSNIAKSNKEYDLTEKSNENDYKLKWYQANAKDAERKAAKFNEKKDNKGLKSYLNGLVKDGKLTKNQADDIYEKYKYVATGGSGGGRRRSGSGGDPTGGYPNGGTPSKGDDVTDKHRAMVKFALESAYKNVFQRIRNPISKEFKYSNSQLKAVLNDLVDQGKLTKAQMSVLYNEFKDNSHKG